METMLKVQNLCKRFGETPVLNNVNFEVERGEFIAIMGQSGSGKSTLLYSISGMDRPTSGSILLKGKDLSELDDQTISEVRLKQMGFVFQHSYLLKNLSLRDNIVLPGFKLGKFPREQVNQKVDALMARTGIDNVAGHDIKKVSGGQLQRAAICRALINQPDILFGDEPTGALNSSTSREVLDIINRINHDGTTVIMVTHDVKVAARADRIIFLLDGDIHDNLTLGKYDGDRADASYREKILYEWLETKGF